MSRFFYLAASMVVMVSCQQMAIADTTANDPEPKNGNGLDSGQIDQDALGGIVIDRTITVLGWDFYKSFSEIWQALHPDSKFTLTITERPTAKYGSEIWVDYKRHRVFHTFLSPARSAVREETKQATEMVYENIVNMEIQSQLFQDQDLGPEEL